MTSAAETHAEQQPGPRAAGPVDDALRGGVGRAVHEAGLGRFAAEGQRGQRLRAEVDREDLQHRQRQRDRPPERAKIRNGTTSGTACAKM